MCIFGTNEERSSVSLAFLFFFKRRQLSLSFFFIFFELGTFFRENIVLCYELELQ